MSLFSQFVDRNTKDLQKGTQQIIGQTRNVIDQNTDTLTNSNPFDISSIGPINLSGTPASGGGKGAPSYSVPSLDLSSLQPNLDQDLMAPVTEAIQDINVPRPNTDQDLTKISVRGLQESAVEQGTQLQQEAINTGTKIQETVVQAGSNLQEAAVQAGSSISGGQSNPTLENAEEQITNYTEEKIIPAIATGIGDVTGFNPVTQILTDAVYQFEKLTPSIEMMGSFDLAGGGSVQDTSDPNFGDSQLSADPTNLGDEQFFGDL